jgi:hypothetical protein
VKTAHPAEGRERERERERERVLHFAARGNKKERTTNTYCTLAAERRRNGKTDEEERREFAPVLDLVFLFLLREEIDTHYTQFYFYFEKNLTFLGFDSRIIDSSGSLLHPAVLGSGC